ncbi:glucose PTS transporter subunit IIA [Streptomyces sp. NPDC001604]|uniref:glucose PTS transporter subunit IIA n=1 Tax=Streptomyces sp. NPDC001604 TaxID=3364593 RepID=UPI0036D0E845
MQYQQVANDVLRGVGGESNIRSVESCATRLRFHLVDRSKADKAAVETVPGVIAVVESGGQFQVVIGNRVKDVYAELQHVARPAADADGAHPGPAGFGARMAELITSIFTPLIWVLAGAGLLKALLAVGVKISPSFGGSTTYAILFAAGDAVFQFMPILLAVTAARRFKADQMTSLAIAGALIYTSTIGVVAGPKGTTETLKAFYDGGGHVTFLGVPVVMITYLFAVIPTVVAVYAQSRLEPLLKRVIPDVLRNLGVPLLTLAIVVPVTLLAIGPATDYAGTWLSDGINWLWDLSPIAGGVIVGALYQVTIIFGLHFSFAPIILQQLSTSGASLFFGAFFPPVLAQGGATLAVFLRTRDRQIKAVAGTASISALVAGVTEPAVYGVTLRYKRPFVMACIAGGIGGGIIGASHSGPTALVLPSGLTIGSSVGVGNYGLFLLGSAVAAVLGFVLTLVSFKERNLSSPAAAPVTLSTVEEPEPTPSSASAPVAVAVRTKLLEVLAPVSGTVVALADVPDKVFASGAIGEGAGLLPATGEVRAPFGATVITAMPHAYGLRTDDGVEVLVHVGIDTVKLEGRHFRPAVTEGTRVRPGDLLVEFDPQAVRDAGYDPVTVVLVTAKAGYAEVGTKTGNLLTGDPFLTLQP